MLAGRAADAVNAFAFDLYEQMEREQGNLFFSPLSIATALSMTYAGAAGQTAAEMEQVLHLGSEPGIHEAFGDLVSSLEIPGIFDGPALDLANALWPATGLPVTAQFRAIAEGDYDSHVQTVDYSNPSAAEDIINDWVANATKGRIQDLVSDLSADTAMVLTNSIYFKAFWNKPFDRRFTRPAEFKLDDGSVIQTPMMVTQFQAASTSIDGFRVFDMPFKPGLLGADLSMVFVMAPTAHDLSSDVYAKIDAWLDGPQTLRLAELQVPKFKTEVSTNLNEVLSGLGMPTAFDPGAADFSAMTPTGVYIDKVFHKTFLELNEEGTEAAAAAEVQLAICFAKGTPVLTPDGEKAIDQLQPGDLVLARDEGNLEGDLLPKRVEAVFVNEAAILEVHIRGQVIRTTEQHPFFVKRRGWTPAGELRRGEFVFTNSGEWIAVDEVRSTSAVETVYNMRVADFHTYFVGAATWGFAVWVHNSCLDNDFYVNRPFHMIVRDNTTSTILFMGRIDDPSQLQNTVSPTVVDANADFDGNQAVDGTDFLAWQRGVGRTTDATLANGDSDVDGDVDGSDMRSWAHTYGWSKAPSSAELPAAASMAAAPQDAALESLSIELLDAALMLNLTSNDQRSEAAPLTREFPKAGAEELARVFGDPSFSPLPTRQAAFQRLSEMPNRSDASDEVAAPDFLSLASAGGSLGGIDLL